MRADAKLLAARARAAATKVQLMHSVEEAKTRLDPRRLAEGAVASVRAKATDLAEDSVEAVRERPAIAAAAATGALLLLLRRPITRWFTGKGGNDDATAAEQAS